MPTDNCGGFKVLRDYAVRITYMILISGIVLVFTQYKYLTLNLTSAIWYEYLLNPIFSIIGTIAFFAPMYRAHKEMERGKKQLLNAISEEIDRLFYKIVKNGSIDKKDFHQKYPDLDELLELHSVTAKFPDWPFDIQAFRSYLASIITPLLAILANIFQSVLKNYLFS